MDENNEPKQASLENDNFFKPWSERRCRDTPALIFQTLFYTVLAILVGYCAYHRRTDLSAASSSDSLSEISNEVDLFKWLLLLLTLFNVPLNYIMFVFCKHCIGYWLRMMTINLIVFGVANGFFFWFFLFDNKVIIIVLYIVGIVIICIGWIRHVFWIWKNTRILVQFFTEINKVLDSLSKLYWIPCFASMVFIVTMAVMVYGFCLIGNSGRLVGTDQLTYEKDVLMWIAFGFHMFGTLWLIWFIMDCECLLISGVVTQWYFSRDKKNIKKPVLTSLHILFRYSMGTVAVGSFLRTIIQPLKRLISAPGLVFRKTNIIGMIGILEHFYYWTKSGTYVFSALYGFSFFKAGWHSVDLRLSKLCYETVLGVLEPAIGSTFFFLWAFSLFLNVSVSTLMYFIFKLIDFKVQTSGYLLAVVLCVAFAAVVSNIFLLLHQTVLDVLFLCYLEDVRENNETTKPHYVEHELKEIIEHASPRYRKSYEAAIFRKDQNSSNID